MSSYLAKPPTPLWQPGRAPAGCRLYLPLAEYGSPDLRDASGRPIDGSLVGSPSWGYGPFGPQLGGFSTANYVKIDPAAPVVGPSAGYPFWMATLAANSANPSGTGFDIPLGAGRSTSAAPFIGLCYNANTTLNSLCYFLRDDASGGPAGTGCTATVAAANDGQPHVLMGVSYAANDHRLYWDGRQVASSTASIGATTLNTLSLGALRRTTVGLNFQGQISAAAAGNGSAPDPAAFAGDWLTGSFAAVRPRSRLIPSLAAIVAAAGGGGPAPQWPAALLAHL